MSVELAFTPDIRWDVDLQHLALATRQAGFGAVGLKAEQVDIDTRSLLASAGLRCHELLAHVVSADEASTLSSAERMAQAADAVRAQWVLTVLRTGLSDSTTKLLQRSAAMFAEPGRNGGGVHPPRGRDVSAGRPGGGGCGPFSRAGILIDSWHFSFGDSTWEDLSRVPLEQIAYVQFADGLDLQSDDLLRETLDRRVMPGHGTLDLDRFATTLLARGWDGLVSVEVLE